MNINVWRKLCYKVLITISIIAVLIAPMTSVGCSSKKVLREYLDEVLPLCEYYTRTMELVTGKGMSDISVEAQAEWLANWKSYLVLLKGNLESIAPPEEADFFHWLVLDSIEKAIIGVSKLADAHEQAAASYSEKPDLEQLRSGYIDIDSALIVWKQASAELAKLVEMVNK